MIRLKTISLTLLITLCLSSLADDFSVVLNQRKLSQETLVIAAQEIPPYFFTVNEQVQGLFYEVAHDVCEQEKLKCAFFTLPFRRALHYITSGKVHITLPMGKSDNRLEVMDFSEPVLNTGYVFFGHREYISTISNITNLSGAVGVHSKSSTENKLRQIIRDQKLKIEIEQETDVIQVFEKLTKKRYQYIFMNKEIVSTWQKDSQKRKEQYMTLLNFLSPIQYHIAYTKNFSSDLTAKNIEIFKKGLNKYLKTKKFQKRLEAN